MRFRHILTMVLDGVRILELWGRRGYPDREKADLKNRSPKMRAVALKRFCLAEKALPRTVALKTNPQRHLVWKEIWYEIRRKSEGYRFQDFRDKWQPHGRRIGTRRAAKHAIKEL